MGKQQYQPQNCIQSYNKLKNMYGDVVRFMFLSLVEHNVEFYYQKFPYEYLENKQSDRKTTLLRGFWNDSNS